MSNLKHLLYELESKIDNFETINLGVSKSTIGWQIDHSLRVFNGVIPLLIKSNPANYKWKFNFKRTIVFSLNKIPRGKANAPKNVQFYEKISKQDLINQI